MSLLTANGPNPPGTFFDEAADVSAQGIEPFSAGGQAENLNSMAKDSAAVALNRDRTALMNRQQMKQRRAQMGSSHSMPNILSDLLAAGTVTGAEDDTGFEQEKRASTRSIVYKAKMAEGRLAAQAYARRRPQANVRVEQRQREVLQSKMRLKVQHFKHSERGATIANAYGDAFGSAPARKPYPRTTGAFVEHTNFRADLLLEDLNRARDMWGSAAINPYAHNKLASECHERQPLHDIDLELSLTTLRMQNGPAWGAIIRELQDDPSFVAMWQALTKEDASGAKWAADEHDRLTAAVTRSLAAGSLSSHQQCTGALYNDIDVSGLHSEDVADEIIRRLGHAAHGHGVPIVLVGLPGVCKDSTAACIADRLKQSRLLSVGDLFRCFTLLAATHCEHAAAAALEALSPESAAGAVPLTPSNYFTPDCLTAENVSEWASMIQLVHVPQIHSRPATGDHHHHHHHHAVGDGVQQKHGEHDHHDLAAGLTAGVSSMGGQFDVRVKGLGFDFIVSAESTAGLLRSPKVSPEALEAVVGQCQGQVVAFVNKASNAMVSAGLVPLVVGKEQTVDFLAAPSKTGLLHQEPDFHQQHHHHDAVSAAAPNAMHRFRLVLSDPVAAAMRRAAQKLAAHASASLDGRNAAGVTQADVMDALKGALKLLKPKKKRQTLAEKGRTKTNRGQRMKMDRKVDPSPSGPPL